MNFPRRSDLPSVAVTVSDCFLLLELARQSAEGRWTGICIPKNYSPQRGRIGGARRTDMVGWWQHRLARSLRRMCLHRAPRRRRHRPSRGRGAFCPSTALGPVGGPQYRGKALRFRCPKAEKKPAFSNRVVIMAWGMADRPPWLAHS